MFKYVFETVLVNKRKRLLLTPPTANEPQLKRRCTPNPFDRLLKEFEAKERAKREQVERERTERERAERERAEQERAERERAERERAKRERVDRERAERERAERERTERERAELERLKREKLERRQHKIEHLHRVARERAYLEERSKREREHAYTEPERNLRDHPERKRQRAEVNSTEQERIDQKRTEKARGDWVRVEHNRPKQEFESKSSDPTPTATTTNVMLVPSPEADPNSGSDPTVVEHTSRVGNIFKAKEEEKKNTAKGREPEAWSSSDPLENVSGESATEKPRGRLVSKWKTFQRDGRKKPFVSIQHGIDQGRLFHSVDQTPLRQDKFDIQDSDCDDEPEQHWRYRLRHDEIVDFVDTIPSEMLVMNLWNQFIGMEHRVHSDACIAPACKIFVQKYHRVLRRLKLEVSFLRFLADLTRIGLIDSDDVYFCVTKMKTLGKNDDKCHAKQCVDVVKQKDDKVISNGEYKKYRKSLPSRRLEPRFLYEECLMMDDLKRERRDEKVKRENVADSAVMPT